MAPSRFLKSGYALNVARNIFARGLLLVELRLVTDALSVGEFALANGIIYGYNLISPLLVNAHWTIATRHWGSERASPNIVRLLGKTESQLVLFNSGGFLALLLVAMIGFPGIALWAAFLYAASNCLANILDRQWLLLAENRVARLGLVQFAVNTARVLIVLIIGNGLNTEGYLALVGLAHLMTSAAFYASYSAIPLLRNGFRLDEDLFRGSLKAAATFSFSSIYTNADVLMLTLLFHDPRAGLYAAGYQIYKILAMLRGSLLELIYPRLTLLPPNEIRERVFRLQIIGWAPALTIVAGGKLFAPLAVSLLLGSGFRETERVLPLLLLVAAITWANFGTSLSLFALGQEQVSVRIMGAAALINTLLNLTLIPTFSIYGAAWATVVAESLIYVFSATVSGQRSWILALCILGSLLGIYAIVPTLRVTL